MQRRSLFRRSGRESLLIAMLCGVCMCDDVRAEIRPFCAKPWSDLTAAEKATIDKITSEISSDIKPGPVPLWDTKTIPYYVESGLDDAIVTSVKDAATTLARTTLVRLVRCGREIAKEPNVRAYVYIGLAENLCTTGNKDPKKRNPCSVGLGMQLKNSARASEPKPADSEGRMAELGAKVGLRKNDNLGPISKETLHGIALHELIHRLGFSHQHQSPYAARYVTMNSTEHNCVRTKEHTWLPHYDPASIMHYKLEECGRMQLSCVQGKETAGRIELKTCEVDGLLSKGGTCLYAPDDVKGAKCFRRPPSTVAGGQYTGHEFGQHQCMSMLDQAWILSRYSKFEKDRYGVADLSKKGICEAEPP